MLLLIDYPRSLDAPPPPIPHPSMKTSPGVSNFLLLLCASLLPMANGQQLPVSLDFSVSGSFANGSAEGDRSILITDNDLQNGYRRGFDLTDAPDALQNSGPEGSAAFQWGKAASDVSYSHPSALWFQPISTGAIAPEQSFDLGYLFYRNGTISTGTGANWVDIALTVSLEHPLGIDPFNVTFGTELINSTNSNDPVSSADIVSLSDLSAPIDFTDESGNRYYLELTFQVDQDTIDGTLSTPNEFRVFEGAQGRATLVGRFTTDPVTIDSIPEPSAAFIGAIGFLVLLRRRR